MLSARNRHVSMQCDGTNRRIVRVRQGEDLQVVDNVTGRDLTAATLAQVIFEEEKRVPRIPAADHQDRTDSIEPFIFPPPSMRAARFLLTLKNGRRLGATWIASPVWGFRPSYPL